MYEHGKATITISRTDFIIIGGPNAVHRPIDLAEVDRLLTKGNTTFNMSRLPNENEEAQLASQNSLALGNYYEVDVIYDFDIVESINFSIPMFGEVTIPMDISAYQMLRRYLASDNNLKDFNKYGIIGVATNKDGRLFNEKGAYNSFKDNDENGTQVLDQSSIGNYNVIWLSENEFGADYNKINEMSPEEVIVHGIGHTAAEVHEHGQEDYQYHQEGLQSNEGGKVYPTKENTLNIINDPKVRQTINE